MQSTAERHFGRLPYFDSRNLRHPMRAPLPGPRATRYWRRFEQPLDQGKTGTCVSFTGINLLRTSPVIRGKKRRPDPHALYRKLVLADPWPENDHEATGPVEGMQSGTSTLALMLVLRELGFIDGFAWEYLSADVIADTVSDRCPVIIGVPWWRNWFQTDDEGHLLKPDGRLSGYHATFLSGWNEQRGMFRGEQTWGRSFGAVQKDGRRDGQFWLSPEDLEYSLHRNGEAVIPAELRPDLPA